MPITIDYGSPAAAGGAALAAGYGQYLERMRNSQQQERMQERGIQAQQQMAAFQAQQDANKILWNANNADVMANRDMGRAQTMGQFRQGLEQEQFGWQAGHQQEMQQNQFGQQRSMMEQQQEHAQQMQADQIRNQSPLIRQMRDLDATEAELQSGRGSRYDDNQFAEGMEGLNKKRQQLMGALKQPTPEEQKAQLETEIEASTVTKPDGSVWFKGPKGLQREMPVDYNKTESGVRAKLEADQAQKAEAVRLKAIEKEQDENRKQVEFTRKQAEATEKRALEFRERYREANQKYAKTKDANGNEIDDETKPLPVDTKEMLKEWQEEQEFLKAALPGYGGPPQASGQQQQKQPPLPPKVQEVMRETGQKEIRTLQDPRELENLNLPPGTFFRKPNGRLSMIPMAAPAGGGGPRMRGQPNIIGQEGGRPTTMPNVPGQGPGLERASSPIIFNPSDYLARE